jgi:CRISPR/Cas system-associated exonuclease Cas4 (RecB family)
VGGGESCERLPQLFVALAFKDGGLLRDSAKLRDRLEELMRLEKRRLGLDEERLVFVGMANIAEYRWCPRRAILRSREDELMFFASYLYDRLAYSCELGLVRKSPASVSELLAIGDEVELSHVEELLRREAERLKGAVGGPRAPPPLTQLSPIERGRALEELLAERYPTIRWNFRWEGYVVVGVPDGITEDFVYEFKTTQSRFLLQYVKPVAFTQADLYGYFFRRRGKRVQIHVVEEGRTEAWEAPVDEANAVSILRAFKLADEGKPPPPAERWKCRRCKYRGKCFGE